MESLNTLILCSIAIKLSFRYVKKDLKTVVNPCPHCNFFFLFKMSRFPSSSSLAERIVFHLCWSLSLPQPSVQVLFLFKKEHYLNSSLYIYISTKFKVVFLRMKQDKNTSLSLPPSP